MKYKLIFAVVIIAAMFTSCLSTQSVQAVSVEEIKKEKPDTEAIKEEAPPTTTLEGKKELTQEATAITDIKKEEVIEPVIEKYIIVEKPIMVGEDSFKEYKRATQEELAMSFIENNNGGIMTYDYLNTETYPIFTQPNRITDICLQPGEFFEQNNIITGDSEKWMFESGLSNSNGIKQQHLYIKPLMPGLETTLIVNTTHRIYRMLIRSYNTKYMSVVQFRYRLGSFGGQFVDLKKETGATMNVKEAERFNFGYKVTYMKNKKPKWLPTVVMDDGQKTYIYLPEGVQNAEIPGVFENKNDIINYRLKENMLIIDKVTDKITLKYDGKTVTIIRL